jgi:hypothetical protein
MNETMIRKSTTVHTARTIMLSELTKVMDFSIYNDNYQDIINSNVFGKKSQDGIRQTSKFLNRLYSFGILSPHFKVFKHFWLECDDYEKPLIGFAFAFKNDYLLQESLSVLANAKIGDKVAIELFMENIEKYHPKRFTDNTLRSVAQNIASSWKQAGFITGKVKNIRTQPNVSYKVVAFAMLLSFLEGDRGDFIMHGNCVNALCLGETKLRELAVEASKRDYLQYQFAGSVTSISFDKLINKIGLDAI